MSLLLTALALSVANPDGAVKKAETKPVLYYIPHTHWEGAVFKTREQYLEMGIPILMGMLDLLKKHPDYRFTLDQVACIKPFLERYPEEAPAFKKLVKEGRLGIAGGMNIMPDDVKPGGEMFVRQVQYGKRWCKEALGVDVKSAWMLDTFGHHPQMPQLLRQAGYTSFWFCRGVPNNKLPSEFAWRGIDGTTINSFWLPGFYGLLYGPPRDQAGFDKFFQDRYHFLDSHAAGNERVGLAGVDVSEPEDYVMPLIDAFNRRPDRPFDIRPSLPQEFVDVVEKRGKLPVLDGDFSPIFQGTFSSRSDLKQTTREIEQKLLNAEKLGAIAEHLGGRSDVQTLWKAWEPVLFNQTHDLASGVMTDVVYEDTKRNYDYAAKIADEWSEARLNHILPRIDTLGEGIPLVVVNTLGFTRNDAVEVELGFAGNDVRQVLLTDWSGKGVPAQIVHADRNANGSIKHCRVAFVAENVPPLGYSVFHAVGSPKAPAPAGHLAGNTLQNEALTVKVDPSTGAITSISSRAGGMNWLSGAANVISRQQDKGDLWELYRGLDGASYIAMTNKQPVPTRETSLLSSSSPAQKPGSMVAGPVFSEFSLSRPFGNGEMATRIRLYNGLGRVDIRSELVNNEKYVRYQALFPIALKSGKYTQEIPFGAAERPEGVENAAQTWVDYGNEKHGVAILNGGMPGNLVTDGVMMLSLMRSHNLGAYGFGGGYEPGMSSESGFGIGDRRTFHYAILPHSGDWREAGVHRAGQEFNAPLLVRKATPHAGSLPSRWSLLEVSSPNVLVTSVKQGNGNTIIVRLYEGTGRPASGVQLGAASKIASARASDLLDTPGQKIKVADGAVTLDFHPFEIKTLILKLNRPAK